MVRTTSSLKRSNDEGRFHLLHGIIHHRTKHTCGFTLKARGLTNIVIHECHDSVLCGHLSENRTIEGVKTCSWRPNWRKDVAEYFQTCDGCQKENMATGKKLGITIEIQEPKSPWEIVHMDWVKSLTSSRRQDF
ncbi:hypothetical protein O181_095536 [Austropuccinia psidii MF-1]|uniref:Integrase zinc-binding domain-containing protein n=1 Tax=Austropuccinia psidii MF-1 TaxID=1389203 RepID=A0A9Q3J5B0_9BASI|nr:hypothetical protein [Austropuccinia psidii MF-1]